MLADLASTASARDRSTSPSILLHFAIGAAQGLALWMLYESVHGAPWRIASVRVFSAAVYLAIAAPLVWYLSHGGFSSERYRLTFAALLGAIFGLLGAHLGAMAKSAYWSASYVFAAVVLGFVATSLANGWDAARRRFNYRLL